MKEVRIGILGLGHMGSYHAQHIVEGRVSRARLTAVCDTNLQSPAQFPNAAKFTNAGEMFSSGLIDAVLIATPHFAHTSDGIAALGAGLHVLVEKPISVHKADCERLIAAYQSGRCVFAAMFNQRTDPVFTKLRSLIQAGELGTVRRIQWTVTNWFRPQAYYNIGSWRATWASDGGGVLLNQCPHNLDLWQWLFGMPHEVRAFAQFGRYHDIEVEDDVTAYFQYENGTTGVFITSTGEAPGTNRLEVAGERGRIVIEDNRVAFIRNEVPMSEFSRTSTLPFAAPETWNVEIPLTGSSTQHVGILTNFVEAILDGTPLIAPAQEGVHSVELANAILLSAFEKETVVLPLSSARYEKFLWNRVAESRAAKP